jgi:hypothetical protein
LLLLFCFLGQNTADWMAPPNLLYYFFLLLSKH